MKKTLLLLGLVVILGACKDKIQTIYIANSPVYTDYETFRSSGGFEAARTIESKGNIYFKDDYLFLVEPEKGIHFIDNSNPSTPTQTGFLQVLGATGMAIKGDYLYVNSFIDLVVYDVSSIANPTEVKRLEDVFPTALPTTKENYPIATIDKEKGVVTSWEIKKVKEKSNQNEVSWMNCINCDKTTTLNTNGNTFTSFSENTNSGSGVSGSISLFTISGDYLYIVDNGRQLLPLEISNPKDPIEKKIVNLQRNVETLFPYNGYIFMGTPSGMLIYETSSPDKPTYLSNLDHARGCDPVVVQDDIAYVTVRTGGTCGGSVNQLDVIDVSNMTMPTLLKSFSLKNPHGLGIDGDRLFVCDGNSGLKVFDATTPIECGDHLLQRFEDIQATDIIPIDGIAMVIGDDGIYQYDYSNPDKMVFLSKIKF